MYIQKPCSNLSQGTGYMLIFNACSSSFGQGSFHESQKGKTNTDSGNRVTWSGSGGIEQETRVKEHNDDHIHTLQPCLFAVYNLEKRMEAS